MTAPARLTVKAGRSTRCRGWPGRALAALAIAVGLATACEAAPNPYIHLQRATSGAGIRLELVPAPGVRINARVKPVLERVDGSVLAFEGSDETADSSYFTGPLTLLVGRTTTGIVRASVCPRGERVCRMVEIRTSQ
ncbi:MAG TPA: hypothetical protein VH879_05050 [Gemmatimonadales bacterium]